MKTIVLDDDPTGTQSASHVTVLLQWDTDVIVEILSTADSVYLQTNSRALNEIEAVALATKIKSQGLEVEQLLGERVDFILRGDSTLRGHVFAETEVFLELKSSILFLPAYPGVGRRTINGEHYVEIEGLNKRADETEFAHDPIFSFNTSTMVDFVSEKSDRIGVHVGLDIVRGPLEELATTFSRVPPGTVIVPDAETDDDIYRISLAIEQLRSSDAPLVVRSAAPLAALLAGALSTGYIEGPLKSGDFQTLLIAGSHTEGATKQVDEISSRWGQPEVLVTEDALKDPVKAAQGAIVGAKLKLKERRFAVITSERTRLAEHNTLKHGELVMNAITETVKGLESIVDVIITKGGITSAEVARAGIGAKKAWVLGQILPGISVWELENRVGHTITYVVVPGNVGDPHTLIKVLEIIGLR